MKRYFREWTVAGALVALLVALRIFAPAFYSPQPLLSLATYEAPTLIVACGMATIIICRQIDISVGASFAVCGTCGALLMQHGWPCLAVLPITILLGALMGAFNGALVACLGLPSIVVTLATMVTWGQGLRWLRQGVLVDVGGAQWFGLSQAQGQWIIILTALIIVVLNALVLKNVAAGRFVYAVGTNAEAARLAGLRPRFITFMMFVRLGAFTGLAAFLNAVQAASYQPNPDTGLELKTIAAVVVGGVAISGGRGNLWGVFCGVVLLACVSPISPALVYLGIPPYWGKAIQGAIILLAVMADGLRTRKQNA